MSGSFHIHVLPNFPLSLSYFLTPLFISLLKTYTDTHSPITCFWPGVVAIHLHIYILIPVLTLIIPLFFSLPLNFPPFSLCHPSISGSRSSLMSPCRRLASTLMLRTTPRSSWPIHSWARRRSVV